MYIGVYGYADDLSLLCPSFSGLNEMLNTCKRYANDKKITFNSSKKYYYTLARKMTHCILRSLYYVIMKHGQIIHYEEKCINLGNTLNSSSIKHAMLDSVIIDLNVKTNNLLSEFSFSESITLSRLFKSYCMNVYGSPLWRYNNHNNIERFCIA